MILYRAAECLNSHVFATTKQGGVFKRRAVPTYRERYSSTQNYIPKQCRVIPRGAFMVWTASTWWSATFHKFSKLHISQRKIFHSHSTILVIIHVSYFTFVLVSWQPFLPPIHLLSSHLLCSLFHHQRSGQTALWQSLCWSVCL